jgi:hypothetical protein
MKAFIPSCDSPAKSLRDFGENGDDVGGGVVEGRFLDENTVHLLSDKCSLFSNPWMRRNARLRAYGGVG